MSGIPVTIHRCMFQNRGKADECKGLGTKSRTIIDRQGERKIDDVERRGVVNNVLAPAR
jgi:hypothetical protein